MAEDSARSISIVPSAPTPVADGMDDLFSRTMAQRKKLVDPLVEEQRKAAREFATTTGDTNIKKAELEAKAAGAAAGAVNRVRKEFEPQLTAPAPTMKIDDDSKTGMMGLLALIPVAAATMGGKGHASALGALQSMSGLLEGYRQGNQDRIAREKDKFNKELENFKYHQEQIKAAYQRALESAKYNATAAATNLKVDLAKLDAKLLLAQVDKESITAQAAAGIATADRILEKIASSQDKVSGRQPVVDASGFYRDPVTMELKTDPQGQPIKAGGTRAQRPLISQDEEGNPVYRDPVSKEILTDDSGQPIRPAAKQGKGLVPSATDRKNYFDHFSMSEDIDYLENKLSDPKFAKKIDDYRVLTFLEGDTNKFMTQLLSSSLPEDIRQFVIRANAFRNTYYLAISGKAVTGGEAQRNYTVVPQPGDSSSVLKDKLSTMKNYLNNSTEIYESIYPDLAEVGKKRSSQTQKIATEEDIKFTAEQNKMTIEEVKKQLRDRGFKIEGE